jgi:hypothetical protein
LGEFASHNDRLTKAKLLKKSQPEIPGVVNQPATDDPKNRAGIAAGPVD